MKLGRRFYDLQKPFLLPTQRTAQDEAAHMALDDEAKELDLLLPLLIRDRHILADSFLKKSYEYNREMACGSASTMRQATPGGYQVIKMNGMINYRTSGINPPPGQLPVFGQVWALPADEAINVRMQRNLDRNLRLNVN